MKSNKSLINVFRQKHYRHVSGRHALYRDVKEAKLYLLEQKRLDKIAILTQKEKIKLETVRFQTIHDPSSFAFLIDTKANEFKAKIHKIYFGKMIKDKKYGADVELINAYQKQIEQDVADYRKYLELEIQKQTSRVDPTISLEQTEADFAKNVETGTNKINERFAKKQARMIKHYDRIIASLAKREAKAKSKLDISLHDEIQLDDNVVLDVEKLCMFFGGVHAVEDLSFQVKKGEIFGLIGPNGAGKTTVFNCITQFYKPTSGKLYFRNKQGKVIDLTTRKVHDVILEGIVRTFQNIEVVKEVSVLDNLLIAAHRQYHTNLWEHIIHSSKLTAEDTVIRQRAYKVLEFMGLTQYANWYAMGLPYGVLKKIEIARTLMCSPQLIILDEPAAGLNDTETAELAVLINRIKDAYNCTILLVEHDMGLVMKICDTICAISFGKKLAIGTPEQIQSNPDVQSAYLGVQEEE